MRIRYEGELGFGVTAKDLILGTIGQMGVDGAVGHVVEYAGPAIEALSMEGRMTVCNMTIEGGGRAGMIAPDETTFAWFEETAARPGAPRGAELDAAVERWRELHTDDGRELRPRGRRGRRRAQPQVTWGTNPGMVVPVTGAVPEPASEGDERALAYMDLEAGTPIEEIALDRVFIGSCTNSRIGDLRAAAERGPRPPRGLDASARWSCPARRRSRRRPRPRAWTRCSARPASTGAGRAARCAWA